MAHDLHVLIVGAGTSGLLIAQGLKKHNINFTIFEYETTTTYESRQRSWGMTLHWGAEYIRTCLPDSLAARFHETYADSSLKSDAVAGLPIYNGKTGELIMEMAAENPCRVSRSKMRNLFSEGIDIQYGREVSAAYVIDDSSSPDAGRVRVDFVDGRHAIGDIVVGADGAKSQLRECILGVDAAQLTSAPVNLFNFPHKFPAELAREIRAHNALFMTSIHPDHGTMFWLSIMDVPDPSAPETWTFQLIQSWLDSSQPATVDLSTPAGRMKFFKARAAEYAEPWRSAGAAVADDVNIPLDRGTYWDKSQKWDNRGGKMTLCGDAAHPMTPHRGQGLNAALQDSSSFVSAMIAVRSGAQTLESAVQAYDDEVLERGQREMRISLQQSLNIHSWDTLMQSPMFKIGMKKAEAGDGEGGEVK